MKRAIPLILSALLTVNATPSSARDWRPKRQVVKENEVLRLQLDSLRAHMETLQAHPAQQATPSVDEPDKNPSIAMEEAMLKKNTDSLLGQWYIHRHFATTSPRERYNMDTVRFSTDVSDEVLIERLKSMHSFISLPYNETVKNYMVLYSEKMPNRMGEVMGLAKYYMPIFEEAFRKYNLPQELKYVAIVESMLNPRAESRAGAKGIWQFMYHTALNYGLRIDSFMDERLDPTKSSDAAARYFRDAYNIFGDWALAISAYNCGSGNVNKAIRRCGGSKDFWDVYAYLPRETRGYVPAMVGAMYAMQYASEYGIMEEPLSTPVYVDTFHIHKDLHFTQISETVGIPIDDVRDMNPQFYQDIVPGKAVDGGVVLRLPHNYRASFMGAQESIYNYKSHIVSAGTVDDGRRLALSGTTRTTRPRASRATTSSGGWVYYKVRSGDNLGLIARRHHTTVSKLKSWNNLNSDLISVGKRLKVGKN